MPTFDSNAAAGVGHLWHVVCQLVGVDELGDRDRSLVSLSIINAMPTPQLGWQPQLTEPQSVPGPCTRSAQSLKVPMNEMGNQSRVGSPRPI